MNSEDIKPESQKEGTEKKRTFNKTKIITYSAVLSALSMLIVLLMPTVNIVATTVTPASHVPLMLAMMIHPIVAAATAVVTAASFLIKGTYQPVPFQIFFRAVSHIFFVVPGSLLAQKLFKPQNKIQHLKQLTVRALILNGITALIHAVAEMYAVYFAALVLTNFFITVRDVFLVVGLITVAHSAIDFMIAYAIYIPLRRARVVQLE